MKLTARKAEFDEAVKNSDVSILFSRWRRGWKFGAHFVALQHTDIGFVGYNTYSNSSGPDVYGECIDLFLTKKKYFGAVLIGISKKDSASVK